MAWGTGEIQTVQSKQARPKGLCFAFLPVACIPQDRLAVSPYGLHVAVSVPAGTTSEESSGSDESDGSPSPCFQPASLQLCLCARECVASLSDSVLNLHTYCHLVPPSAMDESIVKNLIQMGPRRHTLCFCRNTLINRVCVCGQVLVAIVLLTRWSFHEPFKAKYQFFDLFAGDANGTRVWNLGRAYGPHVPSCSFLHTWLTQDQAWLQLCHI